MVKIIREPLTDINGKDFMTGQPVEPKRVEQEKNIQKKLKKRMKQKLQEATQQGRTDGKIFVQGLGWVYLENR